MFYFLILYLMFLCSKWLWLFLLPSDALGRRVAHQERIALAAAVGWGRRAECERRITFCQCSFLNISFEIL